MTADTKFLIGIIAGILAWYLGWYLVVALVMWDIGWMAAVSNSARGTWLFFATIFGLGLVLSQ